MAKVKKIFPVLQMGCAACASKIETTLRGEPGVESANVNFAASNVAVEYDTDVTSPEKLRNAVRSAGYDMAVDSAEATPEAIDEVQKKKSQTLKEKLFGR